MKQPKQPLTAEQMYKKNQRKSKIFKILSPVVLYGFLGLAVIFVILTITNSLGNLMEIFTMLDKDKLSGEQVAENYAYLVEKWGEWTVIGEDGGLFKVEFIDIRAAVFSGLMLTFLILTLVCLIIAVVVGKILFPQLSKLYKDENQDMVNVATLRTNAAVTGINTVETEKSKRRKNKSEDWF